MLYYSTNHKAARATLREAVVRGLAEDRGLYMPEKIKQLPPSFFTEMACLSFQEVAYRVADAFFGDDIPADDLRRIVNETLQFDTPLVRVDENIFALELFHGPTLAFKDVGARFMARLLQYFGPSPKSISCSEGQEGGPSVNVLVATSGDTGSAVANGFLGVEGIHVYVLYPKGKVSAIQECQFTTLGRNITAIEVDGVFDDCQRLVKSAFMDKELNAHMRLTSANSINVARFLPQAFYYFWAFAQAARLNAHSALNLAVCVPSGNFGNLCSALFGHVMGLPVKRFIAANNANRVVYDYLQTGIYTPRPSQQTIANAMDVGDPSNFARILDLYGREDVQEILRKRHIAQPLPSLAGCEGNNGLTGCQAVLGDRSRTPMLRTENVEGEPSFLSGATFTNEQIADTMRECYGRTGYVLDPHGACGYRALREQLQPGETGIFLETAHPAKFKQTVDAILGTDIATPERLQAFMRGQKQSVALSKDFTDFKAFLLRQ